MQTCMVSGVGIPLCCKRGPTGPMEACGCPDMLFVVGFIRCHTSATLHSGSSKLIHKQTTRLKIQVMPMDRLLRHLWSLTMMMLATRAQTRLRLLQLSKLASRSRGLG